MSDQTIKCGFTVFSKEVSDGKKYVNTLRGIMSPEKQMLPIPFKPKGAYEFTYHEKSLVTSDEVQEKLTAMLKHITDDEDFVNEFSNLLANNITGIHSTIVVVWEKYKEIIISCEEADLTSLSDKYRLFFTKLDDYLQGAVYVKVDLALYRIYKEGEKK